MELANTTEQPPVQSPLVDSDVKSTRTATEAFKSRLLGKRNSEPATNQTPDKKQVEGPVDSESDDSGELSLIESDKDSQSAQEGGAGENKSAASIFDELVDIGDKKVTVKELKDGYLRQQDYTKKTQEVAEKRKSIESELSSVKAEREKYAASSGLLTKIAEDELKKFDGVDWQLMAQKSPNDYIKWKAAHDAAQARYQKVKEEAENFFNEVKTATRTKKENEARACLDKLNKHLKNFNLNAYTDLLNYGIKEGMDKDFLLDCTDPSVFIALYKAKSYDKAKGVKMEAKSKLSPTRVLTGRNEKGQFANPLEGAKFALEKTGERKHAQAAFAAILKNRR